MTEPLASTLRSSDERDEMAREVVVAFVVVERPAVRVPVTVLVE